MFGSSMAWKTITDSARYFGHDFWEEYGDSQVSDLPGMHSGPWHVLTFTAIYLYVILVAGPQFMKSRAPFCLKYLMFAHNVLLTLVNGLGVVITLLLSDISTSVFECRRLNVQITNDTFFLYMGYGYYLSKYIDFFDTLYFVLRKKYTHITPLHLIHHASMPFWSYVGLKFGFYSCNGMIPLANSFVHTVMYTYYALSALGWKKHVVLKRYITLLQLGQFVVIFFHSLYFLLDPTCTMYKLINVLQVLHGILFFSMFYSFYKEAYSKNKGD